MCKDLLPAAWPWLTQHTANPSTAQHAVCCTSEQKPKENNQLFTSIVDNFCKVQPCLGLVFNCKWIVYLRINFTILNRELIMTLSSWLDVHVINNQINKINNREDIQYYSRNTVLRECRRGSSVGYLSSNTVYFTTEHSGFWSGWSDISGLGSAKATITSRTRCPRCWWTPCPTPPAWSI